MNGVTEATATQKWCPLMRMPLESPRGIAAVNRGRGVSCHCLAAGCMFWRWEDPELEVRVINPVIRYNATEEEKAASKEPPPGDGWELAEDRGHSLLWRRRWPTPRRGYCGAAEPRLADVTVSS